MTAKQVIQHTWELKGKNKEGILTHDLPFMLGRKLTEHEKNALREIFRGVYDFLEQIGLNSNTIFLGNEDEDKVYYALNISYLHKYMNEKLQNQ